MTEFDIAISFAGEDRLIAKEIATLLKSKGLKVFYDDYEQANLLGETLTEYLIDIYKNKASYCIVLVSKNYVIKRWTRHEWKAAQARAFEEYDNAYILPIRIDDSELPGLLPTIGYLSLKDNSIDKITDIIVEKSLRRTELNNLCRIANAFFKKGEYEKCIDILEDSKILSLIENDIDCLKLLADSYLITLKREKALDTYQKVRIKQPNVADNWFIIGVCLFRQGNFKDALKYYKKAIELNPKHFTANLDYYSLKRLLWLMKIPFFKRIFIPFHTERKVQKKILNHK
jgi:tetratricopeptide (TPR) repeat protein